MTETTAKKLPAHQNPDVQFKRGQSGNPAGRPKGARSKLSETFLKDLAEHWEANGKKALDKAFDKNPMEYVRVVASLLPRNVSLDVEVSVERIERLIVDPVKLIDADSVTTVLPNTGNP